MDWPAFGQYRSNDPDGCQHGPSLRVSSPGSIQERRQEVVDTHERPISLSRIKSLEMQSGLSCKRLNIQFPHLMRMTCRRISKRERLCKKSTMLLALIWNALLERLRGSLPSLQRPLLRTQERRRPLGSLTTGIDLRPIKTMTTTIRLPS